jgi:hypothetical protein
MNPADHAPLCDVPVPPPGGSNWPSHKPTPGWAFSHSRTRGFVPGSAVM